MIFVFVSDVKKLAAAIVKQWMSLVRNQSGISGIACVINVLTFIDYLLYHVKF